MTMEEVQAHIRNFGGNAKVKIRLDDGSWVGAWASEDNDENGQYVRFEYDRELFHKDIALFWSGKSCSVAWGWNDHGIERA